MDALINVTNLGKRYDGFHLEDIGLAVEAGTVVGLIGSNGAGKTTHDQDAARHLATR